MASRFNEEERISALAPLIGWSVTEGRESLKKCFKFKDFTEAFDWMTRVAVVIEKMDHHPEWSNVYGSVEVILCTHDANGITQLDVDLALAMDKIATNKGQFDI